MMGFQVRGTIIARFDNPEILAGMRRRQKELNLEIEEVVMASLAEQEMRMAVVEKIRAILPSAKILHELPVGGRVADVVAVTDKRVIMFELKSRRDTLARLEGQMKNFRAASHIAIAVLDQKFFDRSPYLNGNDRFVAPCSHFLGKVWAYPDMDRGTVTCNFYRWRIPETGILQPAPLWFIGLLRADEQRKMLQRYRLLDTGNGGIRSGRLAYNLTGKEIAEGVCKELRRRT